MTTIPLSADNWRVSATRAYPSLRTRSKYRSPSVESKENSPRELLVVTRSCRGKTESRVSPIVAASIGASEGLLTRPDTREGPLIRSQPIAERPIGCGPGPHSVGTRTMCVQARVKRAALDCQRRQFFMMLGGLFRLANALVQLRAHYHHCGEAASEKWLSAAPFVRWRAPRREEEESASAANSKRSRLQFPRRRRARHSVS